MNKQTTDSVPTDLIMPRGEANTQSDTARQKKQESGGHEKNNRS